MTNRLISFNYFDDFEGGKNKILILLFFFRKFSYYLTLFIENYQFDIL